MIGGDHAIRVFGVKIKQTNSFLYGIIHFIFSLFLKMFLFFYVLEVLNFYQVFFL